jgi:S-adenosylmethionine/arginine decarboxylase-like enzyme
MFGISAHFDLKNCNKNTIKDKVLLKRYVDQLCELIKMKKFGDFELVHFGKNDKIAGYTLIQKIETSLISGHFVDKTGEAYIDVFSCKEFNPPIVAKFSRYYFEAKIVFTTKIIRGKFAPNNSPNLGFHNEN